MEELMKVFEDVRECEWLPGVKIRRALRYHEVLNAAQMQAALRHDTDEEAHIAITSLRTDVVSLFVFCSTATDMDMTPYIGSEEEPIRFDKLIDELMARYMATSEANETRCTVYNMVHSLTNHCQNW